MLVLHTVLAIDEFVRIVRAFVHAERKIVKKVRFAALLRVCLVF